MPSLGFEMRDCQAWRDCGLPLSTASNEAAKMYDATISQIFGWCDDQSLGGTPGTIGAMLKADPNFVLGHVTMLIFDIMGGGLGASKRGGTLKKLKEIEAMAEKCQINERETDYLEAVKLLAQGEDFECNRILERILMNNPTDRAAIKMCYELNFVNGESEKMRDVIGRVKPYWNKSIPQHSFLYGMWGFGLEETGNYEAAEKSAKIGCELNRYDPWARHCLSHVYEMTGQVDEGLRHLSSSEADWTHNGSLVNHNYWHWSLFHISKGQYKEALDLFDTQFLDSLEKDNGVLTWNMFDASSMLMRLEYEGVDVVKRWDELYEYARPHVEPSDHYWSFSDAHLIFATCRAKHEDVAKKMIQSAKQFVQDRCGVNKKTIQEVAIPIMEAICEYEEGNYEKAVELLYPVKYQIYRLGGSAAQRDVFHQLLIQSAIRSPSSKHQKLAKSLVGERKSLKNGCPLTERLMDKIMAAHDD